jgi:putative transcription factor
MAQVCELCGKETSETRPTWIEGAQLKLCKDCQKFGDKVKPGTQESPAKVVIESRLQQRERRMRTRDVYQEGENWELVEDYGKRIREAREAKGLKIEELGARILEKAATLSKIEASDLRPTDELVAKLEKELGIALMEKVPMVKPEKRAVASSGMTLEHFIKKAKNQ